MTIFSWHNAIKRHDEKELARCIINAGNKDRQPNSDYEIAHPAECRAAQKGDYTEMKIRIKKDSDKRKLRLKIRDDRRRKP